VVNRRVPSHVRNFPAAEKNVATHPALRPAYATVSFADDQRVTMLDERRDAAAAAGPTDCSDAACDGSS